MTGLTLTGCSGPVNPQNSTSNPVSAPPSQILYVSHAQTVSTFAVDPQTGKVQSSGPDVVVAANPASSEGTVQTLASPNGHVLYVSWTDDSNAPHISVFNTNRQGVPQAPPVQTLDMPGQLVIHPSARFAYLVQPTSVMDNASATLRVLNVDPATGKLSDAGLSTSDPQLGLGSGFSLYGISRDGSVLYTQGINSFDGFAGVDYFRHSIDSSTGALGPAVDFFSEGWQSGDLDSSVVGAKYKANLFDEFGAFIPEVTFIDVQSLRDSTVSIHCTSAMLDACLNGSKVQFDPSGDFLLVSDFVLNKLRVLRVDPSAKLLRDTGTALPISILNPPQLWFSPDGSLLYATLDGSSQVHIFRYDAGSGSLTPIGQPAGFATPFTLTPAVRQ